MVNLVFHQALSLHTPPTHHYGTPTLHLYHGHIQFCFLYRLLNSLPSTIHSATFILLHLCINALCLYFSYFWVLFSSLFLLAYFFLFLFLFFVFGKPSNSACSATWQPICMTFCRHKKIWIKKKKSSFYRGRWQSWLFIPRVKRQSNYVQEESFALSAKFVLFGPSLLTDFDFPIGLSNSCLMHTRWQDSIWVTMRLNSSK